MPFSRQTLSRLGPIHWGQSSARLAETASNVIHNARIDRMGILLLGDPRGSGVPSPLGFIGHFCAVSKRVKSIVWAAFQVSSVPMGNQNVERTTWNGCLTASF